MRELRERGSTDVSPRRLALSRASDVHGAARLADAQKSVPFPRSSRRRARPPMTRARTPSRATTNVARTAGDARDARASSCDVCGRRRGRARDAMDPHTMSRDSSNHHRHDRPRHQCDFSRGRGTRAVVLARGVTARPTVVEDTGAGEEKKRASSRARGRSSVVVASFRSNRSRVGSIRARTRTLRQFARIARARVGARARARARHVARER